MTELDIITNSYGTWLPISSKDVRSWNKSLSPFVIRSSKFEIKDRSSHVAFAFVIQNSSFVIKGFC